MIEPQSVPVLHVGLYESRDDEVLVIDRCYLILRDGCERICGCQTTV